MNFCALVVKDDNPNEGHRIYFTAANIDDALIEVDWQCPIGYHAAWINEDNGPTAHEEEGPW